MKPLWVALVLVFLASPVLAQPATPRSLLGWEQPAGSLDEAQQYTHRVYDNVDGVKLIDQTQKKCGTGPTPGEFTCVAPFPALTPGDHTITMTAESVAGESLPSLAWSFRFIVIPAAPRNLRLVQQ